MTIAIRKIAGRSALAVSLAVTAVCAAHADDAAMGGNTLMAQSEVQTEPRKNILLRLRFGLQAYKKGEKGEAFEAYRDVAEQGHPGARWKLAHMYAEGDGVAEDDYEAFKIFANIVRDGAEPGTRDSAFVANALVSLAGYFEHGIPGSPVKADPLRARDLYWQAATSFGEPNAQFEIGRLHLGDGSDANGRTQAAKWFNQAAKKGHAGAKAMLGQIYFERGRNVAGLALLTEALETASPIDVDWIRVLHEEAFALSNETERRIAVERAQAGLASR
ncbi:MAG: tetratricopeptide repeat protein [Pseudomonadota bacterium]